MMPDNFCIGIQPLGEIDPALLKIMAGSFLGELNITSRILPTLNQPDYAFDRNRIQYDAGMIISDLESTEFKGCHKVIALIGEDLFIPVFSFVLGEARMGGSCALISICRLRKKPGRSVKVALHEFGHLMNLHHCQDETCVMKFSKNAQQLDSISRFFCTYCMEQINYQIKIL